MDQYMLTTVDNPYDPFTQFNEWYVWDEKAGYHTLSYLGRVLVTSHELSQADQDAATTQAIDEIVRNNVGLYKKVVASANLDPTT